MKRLSLVLAVAAVVYILGAPLVAFTGGEIPKKVDIQYNDSTNVITVRPDTVRISKQAQEEVDWRCSAGDVEIRFTKAGGGTPFVSGAFHIAKGGGASSGQARSDTKAGIYKYSVIVTIPGRDPNDQPDPLDPEVKVDP